MVDDLQLLLLSSIKIQLWMFRVAAALLWGCTRLSGGGSNSLPAACCVYQLFQELCIHVVHSRESPKKKVNVKKMSFSLYRQFY